jgi:hypothetical protein
MRSARRLLIIASRSTFALEVQLRRKRGRKLVFMRFTLLAVFALLVLTPSCGSSDSEISEVGGAEARRLLSSTPWLDHLPADEVDIIHLLQFDRRSQGLYIHGNAFRGNYDAFVYEATGDELRLTFQADRSRASTRYRIERMKRGGFGLRLTLADSPRGPAAYYGFDQQQDVPAAVQQLVTSRAAR